MFKTISMMKRPHLHLKVGDGELSTVEVQVKTYESGILDLDNFNGIVHLYNSRKH